MKRLILSLCLLINLVSFSRVIDFSIITMGNLDGNYKKLDSMKIAVDTLTAENQSETGNVIKINVGNNTTEYKEKNDIIMNFFKSTKFNFNFLGKQEYLWREKLGDAPIKMSTLNIIARDVLPYQLMKMEDYLVCVAGITNIYEEDIKGSLSLNRELQNLIYMLEDNIDFLFLVTDLERDQNIELLERYPQITGLFESRLNLYDFGVEQVNGSYIFPTYGISVLEFEYDEDKKRERVKQIDYKMKKAILTKRENVLKPERFGYDRDFSNYINWTNIRLKNENSLIVGYTETSFNPYEVHLSKNIDFLDDLSDKLMKDYEVDLVIYPKVSLKKGLKKGLYTTLEVSQMFTEEKFLQFEVSHKDLVSIFNKAEENRGKESFVYVSGFEKSDFKESYKVLTFENFLMNYEVNEDNYEVDKIGIREYLINR